MDTKHPLYVDVEIDVLRAHNAELRSVIESMVDAFTRHPGNLDERHHAIARALIVKAQKWD